MSYDRQQYLDDLKNDRWCQFAPKHERPVLTALLTECLKDGHTVSIHDSEEWVVKRSTNLNHLYEPKKAFGPVDCPR